MFKPVYKCSPIPHATTNTEWNAMFIFTRVGFCLCAAEQAICLYQNIFSFAAKSNSNSEYKWMNLLNKLAFSFSSKTHANMHRVLEKNERMRELHHQKNIMTNPNVHCSTMNWHDVCMFDSECKLWFKCECLVLRNTSYK